MRAAAAAAVEAATGRVYLGVSGGLDSTVLLHAAASVAAARERLLAVHVHHGLHPDADTWQASSRDAAAAAGIGFVARTVQVKPGGGLEARARAARYAVFESLVAGTDDVLLLAHHRDDQAETTLLRLLQGRGAYGMPPARRLGAGMLLRPFLGLPRRALLAYAGSHGLRWCEDPANTDLGLDRNLLRHRLLPMLRARAPEVDALLHSAAALNREVDAARLADLGDAAAEDRLPLAALAGHADADHRLRVWLNARHVPLPSVAALQEFLRQALGAGADRTPRLDCGAISLRRYRQALYLVGPPPALDEVYPLPLPGRLLLPHGELRVEPAADGFLTDGPVTVRFRGGGERLHARGADKPLKQWFQEAGVPPWARGVRPLLFDARGLLAVPGVAHRDAPSDLPGARFRASWESFL